ncbi:hypothetical protein RIVERRIDER_26 [Xanthomonas phage RiverRider]|uniref:Uncharacterized protein n=1 Tax=Xanthomonas phage RiverRider TaxID=2108116 RepID=A0A2P1JUV9_9CAUD|nr:hypothetical protein HWB58_gp26 [Xanthomonas phage RiverRider]AVO23114.1 hypothetical protein RIVERRIDER_26 [Xanthomonas phage RiverRider]
MRPSKMYKLSVATLFAQLMGMPDNKWLVITRTRAGGGPSRQKRLLEDLKKMAQLANIEVCTSTPNDLYPDSATEFKIGKINRIASKLDRINGLIRVIT